MFGMETGGIYCLLKIHVSNKVAQQKYRLPLVLLVASGSSICEVTFPIPKRHAWREGRSWTFSRRKFCRKSFLEPKHLSPGIQTKP